MLRFLHEHYGNSTGCTSRAALSAVSNDSVEVLEWLDATDPGFLELDDLIPFARRQQRYVAADWLSRLAQQREERMLPTT